MTRAWVTKTSPEIRSRLTEIGLVEQSTDHRSLVSLLDDFLTFRKVADSTHLSYLQTRQKLRLFFGERPPNTVTRGCVDDFRGFMAVTLKLGENTVRNAVASPARFSNGFGVAKSSR